jgi:hypothetical protein
MTVMLVELGVAMLTGIATIAYARGWIGPTEPDLTAIQIREWDLWFERVKNLVEGCDDAQS